MKLLPVRYGLKHQWKSGEVGISPTWYRTIFHMVIEVNGRRMVTLHEEGSISHLDVEELLTVEGYKKHVDYMSGDLTGKQYVEAMGRASGPMEFITPAHWEECEARARGKIK